jgi:hypothetical protein
MPWTIPNLLLHDKSVPLANMRSLGRNRVFVCCGNPDCRRSVEIDAGGFPDAVTFGDLQPRMLCIVSWNVIFRRDRLEIYSKKQQGPVRMLLILLRTALHSGG